MTRFKTENTLLLDDGETEVKFADWDEVEGVLDLLITEVGEDNKSIQTYMYKSEWEAFKRAGDSVFKELDNDL